MVQSIIIIFIIDCQMWYNEVKTIINHPFGNGYTTCKNGGLGDGPPKYGIICFDPSPSKHQAWKSNPPNWEQHFLLTCSFWEQLPIKDDIPFNNLHLWIEADEFLHS